MASPLSERGSSSIGHSLLPEGRSCSQYLEIAVKLSILIFPILGVLTLALTSCVWGGGALIGFGLLLLALRPLVFKKGEEAPAPQPPLHSPRLSAQLCISPFAPPNLQISEGATFALRAFLISNQPRFSVSREWSEGAFRYLEELGLPSGVISYPTFMEWDPGEGKFRLLEALTPTQRESLRKETEKWERFRGSRS